MQFNIPRPCRIPDPDPSVQKIGSLVGIELTGMNYLQPIARRRCQFGVIEVLVLPDELEEAFGHGSINEK